MTPTIADLRRLLAEGTQERPWHFSESENEIHIGQHCIVPWDAPEGRLITTAVNALPAFLDRMEKLEAVARMYLEWCGADLTDPDASPPDRIDIAMAAREALDAEAGK